MFQQYLGKFVTNMTTMFYLCFGITQVRIVTENTFNILPMFQLYLGAFITKQTILPSSKSAK